MFAADARFVGGSHPSCITSIRFRPAYTLLSFEISKYLWYNMFHQYKNYLGFKTFNNDKEAL